MSNDSDPDDSEQLPSIRSDLKSIGTATRTDETCAVCDGLLWSVAYDTVCEQCSRVVGGARADPSRDRARAMLPDAETRSEHTHSEQPRCIGGFPHAYEWGGNPDEPHTFYHDNE